MLSAPHLIVRFEASCSGPHRACAKIEDVTDKTDGVAESSTRSQRPTSAAFREFMASGWAPRDEAPVALAQVAEYTPARRAELSQRFQGVRLVLPAGSLKTRSNDTEYRFRPHSAFAHLTGLGTDQMPNAVLVLEPEDDGHTPTLYFRPLAGRDTEEFFADATYGEFWVGPRPTLDDVAASLGIATADISELRDALAKDLGLVSIARITGVDTQVDELTDAVLAEAGAEPDPTLDALLDQATSELRLVKDTYEIEQMRQAVAATIDGFAEVIRSLPRAQEVTRGERVLEGAFDAHAREAGNDVGYGTIAAAGDNATILHWTTNDGPVREDELVLVDAGVEVDSLYTADLTRTLPVSGRFSEVQRRVYQGVLDAADAAFAVAKPGAKFREVHEAAMEVIAARLEEWGLLPVSAAESLSETGGQHRRWMVHGTSHHLGIDVHDCAAARRDLYLDGVLEEGMVFTIEPGLYFKSDDLLVPEEYRGIGVRIEDDVLITADGNENLSAALPRTPDEVEAWMADLLP